MRDPTRRRRTRPGRPGAATRHAREGRQADGRPSGGGSFELEHLVLDINGTLTDHGQLIEGVADGLGLLADVLAIHVLTADTYGTAEGVAGRLAATLVTIADGAAKAARVEALGPSASSRSATAATTRRCSAPPAWGSR